MSVGRVLIYGGKGALGAACVAHFKSVNYVSSSGSSNATATCCLLNIF